MAQINNIVQKLWSLCDILRDDGITYHQYVNELTYLLFLKIAQEKNIDEGLPKGYRWADLVSIKDADKRFVFYGKLLAELADCNSPQVKEIFAHPTSLLRHPKSLDLLVEKIDSLDWYNARKEDFGDLYEGLLQKNANEKKSGAGQYFTPRPLIECMVNVTQPKAGEIIQDPAAGTCGFIVMVNEYIKKHQPTKTTPASHSLEKPEFYAVELVQDTYRLALMNAMLHGIKGHIICGDTLSILGTELPKADLILTNPPFGSKKGGGLSSREDLSFSTSNKQLSFLQHIYLGLKPGGRAAVVLPDNVLFEENIGRDIRKDLMDKCNLHTILILPMGIFYAPGVSTNVLFFTKGPTDKDNTKTVWIYDLRTNMQRFGKLTPLLHDYFLDFENVYGKDPNGRAKRSESDSKGNRWRKFNIHEIKGRNFKLDGLKWLKDDNLENTEILPEPEELVNDMITELNEAVGKLSFVLDELENGTEAKS
jgi:type I restriction enzyme M protein